MLPLQVMNMAMWGNKLNCWRPAFLSVLAIIISGCVSTHLAAPALGIGKQMG